MKIRTITAVSIIALMLAAPAFAADVSTTPAMDNPGVPVTADTNANATTGVKGDLNKASAEMRETADDIKAFLMGKDTNAKLEPVLIHRAWTAHGLIGADIVNPNDQKKIATVKDIIMDKDGHAILVVVSDGGVMGIGSKVAAFNYDKVITQQADGKVQMALSQDMIDHAKDFSYDQADWAKAKVIPTGSISTNELLKGKVLDANGKKVASVENIYFRSGEASQIIVGFDKTFGMGGDLAALDYDQLHLVQKGKDVDFELSSAQTAQFKSFKKSVEN